MMRQREIAKAELAGDLAQRGGQRLFALKVAHVPDKRVYTIEHPPVRFRRGTVFQVTSVPQRPFS